MKKIGEGWQCSVYELRGGKVLKKNHSILRGAFAIYQKTKKTRPFGFRACFKDNAAMRNYLRRSMALVKDRGVEGRYLGNPQFSGASLSYTQDKIEPIIEYLNRNSITKQKKILSKCIYLTRVLISKYGIADKSFNIPNNYGVTPSGEVVLCDFGELLPNCDAVARAVENRPWRKKYVAGCIKSPEVKKFFLLAIANQLYSYTVPRVRAICIYDEKIVLIKRVNEGDRYCVLPGGGVERGETPLSAVAREMKEEASLNVYNMEFLCSVKYAPWGQEQHVYVVTCKGGPVSVAPNSEEALAMKETNQVYQPAWFPISEISETKLVPSNVKEKVLEYIAML